MTRSADDVTGVWQGLYSYPGSLEPVPFLATLLQSGAIVTGATDEIVSDPPYYYNARATAALDGARAGSAIWFRKTYDRSGPWRHSVDYHGRISADGGEIDGEWRIEGVWSGRFLMIRDAGNAMAAARRRFARV